MQDTDLNLARAVPSLAPLEWVDRYADYLYAYAFSRLNDEEQAKDVVQETFLSALQSMKKFEGKSSEKTWLTGILKNKIIDAYRKMTSSSIKKISLEISDQEQNNFFDLSDGHWNVGYQPRSFGIENHDPIIQKELAHMLQKCIQKLPRLWLSIFTMKHIDDHLTETICNELNVTPSHFWVIIHRAKVSLRECIQKHWQ